MVAITPLKASPANDVIIVNVSTKHTESKTVRHIIMLHYTTVPVQDLEMRQFDYEELKTGEEIGRGSFGGGNHVKDIT